MHFGLSQANLLKFRKSAWLGPIWIGLAQADLDLLILMNTPLVVTLELNSPPEGDERTLGKMSVKELKSEARCRGLGAGSVCPFGGKLACHPGLVLRVFSLN